MITDCPCCGQSLPNPSPIIVYRDAAVLIHAGKAVRFTADQMNMLYALWKVHPNTVTKERLFSSLYEDLPAHEFEEKMDKGMKIVDVIICKIREGLRKSGVRVEIETAWGKGYYMKVPAA